MRLSGRVYLVRSQGKETAVSREVRRQKYKELIMRFRRDNIVSLLHFLAACLPFYLPHSSAFCATLVV